MTQTSDHSAAYTPGAVLVYDGECPLCRNWCQRARLKDTVGDLRLVDARLPGPEMDRINRAGLDIDQGMVLIVNDALYYGPDAIWMMSLLSSSSGWFNQLNYWFFGTKKRADVFYPIGKAFRNGVLKILGIRYIENLKTAAKQKAVP